MYKIAILGSENTHSFVFAKIIRGGDSFGVGCPDFEIIGAYGNSDEANEKLKNIGVNYIAQKPDEFVGKVDAVMITARHGDKHLKYAEPYFKSGIPMFIDKPFTISESDAVELIKKAKENNCLLCGGSSLKFAYELKQIKNRVQKMLTVDKKRLIGGAVSAPLIYLENSGGFFFYSQHLLEMVLEVFGENVKSVIAYKKPEKNNVTVIFRYEEFDITAHYGTGKYTMLAHFERESIYTDIEGADSFQREFDDFEKTVRYKKMSTSYERLIKPVFVLNAINRSLESGKEEKINTY